MLVNDSQIRNWNRTLRTMYGKRHMGMTEEQYPNLRDLLETLKGIYTKHRKGANASCKLKTALDSTVNKIKEIDF